MKKYAVIVAGGSGTRFGGSLPKQFHDLEGKPLLWWSLKAFHDEDTSTEIICVLPASHIALWQSLCEGMLPEERIPHRIAAGGATRTASVESGLCEITGNGEESLVAVHDGARPLVTREMIAQGWESALASGAAIPAIPVTDSLRLLEGEESRAIDRSRYVAVQTPQVFKTEILKSAYRLNPEASFTDDASAAEAAGYKPSLFAGDTTNIKITNPEDIEIASIFMKRRNG